jgi:hypothetical protein
VFNRLSALSHTIKTSENRQLNLPAGDFPRALSGLLPAVVTTGSLTFHSTNL